MHLVTFIAICIASVLPIVAIVVLNTLKSTKMKLSVMALFTVSFCILFGFFTGARKAEMFAASAA